MAPSRIAELSSDAEIDPYSGTANEKGTGIGLLLVKEYLRTAGGSLKITSEEGKGSSFTALLPL
jgi:signal transduction histidine kinase